MPFRFSVVFKLEIGGLSGMVAGWLGKVPPELRYWTTTGPAPAFVKFEGATFLKDHSGA